MTDALRFCSLPREHLIAESTHTLTTQDAWLYREFADGVGSPSRARARRSSRQRSPRTVASDVRQNGWAAHRGRSEKGIGLAV